MNLLALHERHDEAARHLPMVHVEQETRWPSCDFEEAFGCEAAEMFELCDFLRLRGLVINLRDPGWVVCQLINNSFATGRRKPRAETYQISTFIKPTHRDSA